MLSVFFAYSHRDQDLRNEVDTHLSLLKRQGIIQTWYDRRIGAGEEIDASISRELEAANIIILLVSPYFLASDYCFDIEMQRAMEKHAAGSARVVPVILHPCDWQSAPFGKLKVLPTDGKPVSAFPNHHDALVQIATAIREVAAQSAPRTRPRDVSGNPTPERRGHAIAPPPAERPRVTIPRRFTEKDRDDFLEETFEVTAKYFEESLSALGHDNAEVETRFRRVDGNTFVATVYVRGSVAAKCKVRVSVDRGFAHGITYSSDPASENSYNELLSVEGDEGPLSLKAMGMATFETGHYAGRPLTQDEAADYYWRLFISRLRR